MLNKDSFNAAMTSVEISCCDEVTGLERIMLSARGDLQRLLSSFLARPIFIDCIYARTSPRLQPASPDCPITQQRQVHLVCSGRIVCTATSTVTITSPDCERLCLDEKYAIGQIFAQLSRAPRFALLDVKTQVVDGRRELQRTYTLETEGFACHILEIFPDRDMFSLGEAWFTEENHNTISQKQSPTMAEAGSLSLQSGNFFDFTPHTPSSTSTLSTILERQAADPVIGCKVFAAYPALSASITGTDTYNEITYRDIARLVRYQASSIHKRLSLLITSQKETAPVIAVLCDSSFGLAVVVLALLRLNVTVFLLAPSNSEPAIAHLLTTTNVSVLLHGQDYAGISQRAASGSSTLTLEIDPWEIIKAGSVDSLQIEDSSPILHPSFPEVPIIVHSSGSTSFPKPVRWSNNSFLSNSQVMLTTGGWSAFTQPNNRFLCLGPLYHTLGLTIGLGGAICAGTTIVFPLTRSWPPTPDDLVQTLRSTEVKTSVIVPLLLEQLADALEAEGRSRPFDELARLDLLISGGAHCPEKLAVRLISHGVNLKNIYGSSETGHLMIGAHERSSTSDFHSWNRVKPFPHTQVILKPIENPDVANGDQLYQVHVPASDVRMAVGVLEKDVETWNTGDVVQESPPGSGWYKLLYRDDDILVHVSGEKTNPVLMETICRSHQLISRIAIVGHRRTITAAIVQLNRDRAQKLTNRERFVEVRKAIKEANNAAPSHSQVVEEMILILPLDSQKTIPITPKGNCVRPKVLQTFSEEIDALYKDFEGETNSLDGYTVAANANLSDVADKVKKIFFDVVESPVEPVVSSRSLFELGLDSVTAMRLRKKLAQAFEVKLSPQFVYQNFSLDLLAAALHNRIGSRTVSPTGSNTPDFKQHTRGDILSALMQRQIDYIRTASGAVLASRTAPQPDVAKGQVVAVVGASGSLGAWQVKSLLDRADVRKVVCLVRGADVSAVYRKLSAGFINAAHHDLAEQCDQWRDNQLAHSHIPAVELDQRLVALPFDLSNPVLLRQDYMSLATHLTTIIHTAWKMDFNQVAQDFEKDCLNGTTQLLLLAAFMRPKSFFFVSSIGTVLESQQTPVPETLPPWSKEQYITASPHGYSESKFVCEYMINAASSILEIPCFITRIGQISGDTVAGVWKTQEMNVLIIAGSIRIGKFPVVPSNTVDWIPVDIAGRTTVELALQTRPPGTISVYHLTNPTLSTSEEMLKHLQAAGLLIVAATPSEWWTAVQADDSNPCLAIEAYIEETVVNAHIHLVKTGGRPLTLDLTETLKVTPNSLAQCPPLDENLWRKYVRHWQEIGFIPK